MTGRTLTSRIAMVAAIYLVAIAALVIVRVAFPGDPGPYDTFKDLIPLIFAIPAAYLGVCFQKRASYVSHLRTLWSDTVSAVQNAFQYTHAGGALRDVSYGSSLPTQEQYGTTLRELSSVIDKIRGVFRNVGEEETYVGVYPFESLKDIYDIISGLGFGSTFSVQRASEARVAIWQRWDVLRKTLPLEFERDNPTFVETQFLVRTRRVKNVRDAFYPNGFTYEITDNRGPTREDLTP